MFSPSPSPDRTKAETFLKMLAPDTTQFTFQTATDPKEARKLLGKKRDPLARILHGTLADCWDQLVKLSAAGAGVYVAISETNLRGRKTTDIIRVRAYFVDLDGAPPENLKRLNLRPHMITLTSPGKFHVYWLVKDAPLEQFKQTQKRLAKLLDGDPNVCDLPRVMRLPGLPHQKQPDKPFLVDIFTCEFPPYSDAEFRAALTAAEELHSPRPDLQQKRSSGPSDMTQGYQDDYRTHELTTRAGWCLGPWRMSEGEAEQACLKWNQHNDPPLPVDKVCETVASIAKAEASKRADGTSGNLFYTDLGNARRLVKRHGENIRFIHEWEKWIIWNGHRWEVDNDGAVLRLAKETVTAMYSDALQIMDESQRKALIKHALKSQDEPRLKAMVSLAESEIEVVLSAKTLDANPWLLGVQNGVIELKAGNFRAGRQEDYITKQAGVSYDPIAQCREWLEFLDTITGGDKELQAYLQRANGYCLTGSVREEVTFVGYGTGNNGKSTYRETVHALLGDYALAADASLLTERRTRGGATEEIARLKGCRFVAVNETNENDQLNEARVKFITSQDTMTARYLYGHLFDFFPTHKTFVTTNHKPIVRGTDKGIWRRLHLIPFTVTIPEDAVEKNFRERRLMPELPGILNWALQGVAAYLNEGLNPPPVVRAATDDYRQDMDVVGQWIEERCVCAPDASTPTSIAYLDYTNWAAGEIGWALTHLRWRRNLSDRGFEAAKGAHGQRVIKRLGLKFSLPPMTVVPGGRSSPSAS
jgi:putative DNA primase/helicase